MENHLDKIVYTMNTFFEFDNSFRFLRRLVLKVKRREVSEEEKQIYLQIFEFWKLDDFSIMTLALMSGNYKLFYRLIINISNREINERHLQAFQNIVKSLESPYFAYIRLGRF